MLGSESFPTTITVAILAGYALVLEWIVGLGAGHRAVIKPWPLRAAIPGGFTLDDFTHDPTSNTVTCPNGIPRPITGNGAVTFGAVRGRAHVSL